MKMHLLIILILALIFSSCSSNNSMSSINDDENYYKAGETYCYTVSSYSFKIILQEDSKNKSNVIAIKHDDGTKIIANVDWIQEEYYCNP